jgi:hypothetical protein
MRRRSIASVKCEVLLITDKRANCAHGRQERSIDKDAGVMNHGFDGISMRLGKRKIRERANETPSAQTRGL